MGIEMLTKFKSPDIYQIPVELDQAWHKTAYSDVHKLNQLFRWWQPCVICKRMDFKWGLHKQGYNLKFLVWNVWHLEHHTVGCFLVVFNPKSLIHCCEQNSIQHSSIQVDSVYVMSVQKLLELCRKPHSKNFWWLCNDWMWFRRLNLIGIVHTIISLKERCELAIFIKNVDE